MFETKITKMLEIEYPIIGGTMMWISDADFVAAISNAGGLGVLASAIYQSKEEFSTAIDRVYELTDKPFAVNINLFPSMRPIDNNEYVDILIEKGVKIVVKKHPLIQLVIGSEDMKNEDIKENIEALLTFLKSKLPKGINNIKDVYLKFTMKKPIKIGVK